MTKRSTDHATFSIERKFTASPAQVFAAWADIKAKARWFKGPAEWKDMERTLDFRVGGRERLVGIRPDGKVSSFDACYLDIVPDQRIIYSYEMHIDEARISVSLATVVLTPSSAGTRMTFTEQAVFLDGFDDQGGRERGTRALLDNLDAALQRETP
jgi:uncharacterized protein YndB with AHSA1/START domain